MEQVTGTADRSGRPAPQIPALTAPFVARRNSPPAKLPGKSDADAATGAGMGGAGNRARWARATELNYSSDIDLICLFDETGFLPPDDYQ